MGIKAPNQPPQIMYPAEGAGGVPTDACVWGQGGTIWDPATAKFRFEHAGGVIEATYEHVGSSRWRSPEGMESIPIARIRPGSPMPARTQVTLIYEGRQLIHFETGDGPGRPSAPPRTATPPPGPPALRPEEEPTTRSIGLEVDAEVFVVDAGNDTFLVVGPVVFGVGAAPGQSIRVRDAQLRVVFETSV